MVRFIARQQMCVAPDVNWNLWARQEKAASRANELGSHLKQRLEKIRSTTPQLVDIRGPGFMVAAELNTADGSTPDADIANRVRAEGLKRNWILLTCGIYGVVVCFLAPLTIPDDVFAEGLDILEQSIEAAKKD